MRRAGLISAVALLALPASAAATTYTVTKTSDSDDGACTASVCSLRDAVKYSASDDKVMVPPGHYTVSGALTVNHNLTIGGAGASTTTIDGGGSGGVLSILGGLNVSIGNLTVTGGRLTGPSSTGAGITSAGNLKLNGVAVSNNVIQTTTAGTPEGAGIYISAGNLTLTSSQVTSNQLIALTAGSSPHGAGIADHGGGLVTISQSQITGNTISAGSGAGARGGGVFDDGTGTLAVSSSQITGNSVSASSGTVGGGGFENVLSGVVSVDQTSISANTASVTGSGSALGGGLDGGNLAVSSSTISGNSATGGSGSSAEGGGLNLSNSTVTASTVNGNTANGNDHLSAGGGIYIPSNGSVVNTTIFGNTATTSGAGTSRGGGIYTASATSSSILNSTIDGNSAPSGSGGGQGGNLFVNAGAPLAVENTIVSGGSAASEANCAGGVTLTSQGHNLESGTDCGFTASGDHPGTDPGLGTLQDNGGPTQTQVVQPGSPIIDAANSADCPSSDQRGVSRPQGSACDIGAIEVELPAVNALPATEVNQTLATLNGTVDPHTLKPTPASYHFEYGTTTAYGTSTPTTNGSGAVSASLSNLTPSTTYHFRLLATNSDGGSAGSSDLTFTTRAAPPLIKPPLIKPRISGLSETRRIFAVGAAVTPLTSAAVDNRTRVSPGGTAAPHPKNTLFSFTLNQAAIVKIKLSAQKPGRQQGRKCKPLSTQLQAHPRCTRSVGVATLTRSGIPGLNLVSFSGRLPHKVLSPGRYQAVFTARNAGGTSGPQTIGFLIVKP
jgi:CSLREA domain-containing protein